MSYKFPFEEEQIVSRKLTANLDKLKYKLQCSGVHKFTIAESIEHYLGQTKFTCRVTALGKVLFGELPAE